MKALNLSNRSFKFYIFLPFTFSYGFRHNASSTIRGYNTNDSKIHKTYLVHCFSQKKNISQHVDNSNLWSHTTKFSVSIAASDIAVVWRTLRRSLPVTKLWCFQKFWQSLLVIFEHQRKSIYILPKFMYLPTNWQNIKP